MATAAERLSARRSVEAEAKIIAAAKKSREKREKEAKDRAKRAKNLRDGIAEARRRADVLLKMPPGARTPDGRSSATAAAEKMLAEARRLEGELKKVDPDVRAPARSQRPAAAASSPAPAAPRPGTVNPNAANAAVAAVQGITPTGTDAIKAIQTSLKNLKFYTGAIDGIWGPQSRAGMRAFQQGKGLRPTGEIDQASTTQLQAIAGSAMAGSSTTATGPGAPTGGLSPTEASALAPNADNAAIEAKIREEYPQFVPWLDHPEIGPILRLAAFGGPGDPGGWSAEKLRGEISKTNWWKTSSVSSRQWEQTINTDPGQANQRRAAKARELDRQAKQMGFVLEPLDVLQLADDSIRFGYGETQEMSALTARVRDKSGGQITQGGIKQSADSLVAIAKGFLVPLSPKDAQKWAFDIQEGVQTAESFTAYARGLAKERFPWLAGQIDSGMTPSGYFGSHRQSIAQVLELGSDEIDLMDPKWRDIVDHVDGKGVRRSMTLGEAEDWARKRPEYQTTDVANQKGYSIVRGLLGDMGAVA